MRKIVPTRTRRILVGIIFSTRNFSFQFSPRQGFASAVAIRSRHPQSHFHFASSSCLQPPSAVAIRSCLRSPSAVAIRIRPPQSHFHFASGSCLQPQLLAVAVRQLLAAAVFMSHFAIRSFHSAVVCSRHSPSAVAIRSCLQSPSAVAADAKNSR